MNRSVAMIVVLCAWWVLTACAGAGGGIGGSGGTDAVTVDDSSGAITICSAVESPTMDLAVENALTVWRERITTPWSAPRIPGGHWLDFQSLMLHEIGHALLRGFGGEHLETPTDAVMHHSICYGCFKRSLTQADLDFVDSKGGLLDAAYLGHQTDRDLCTYTVRWSTTIDEAATVSSTGYIEFRWDMPWLFPRLFVDAERA